MPEKTKMRVMERRVMEGRVTEGRLTKGIHPVKGLLMMITNHLDVQAD